MTDQDRLSELESLIVENNEKFFHIGRALKEIRDKSLYKLVLFETFEAYTRARWDMGRAHAYRLIKSYDVIRNLSPIGDKLPTNESQVRSLVRLSSSEQKRIWKDFLKTGREITALNIKKFIDEQKPDQECKTDLSDRITPEYMASITAMLEQVRVAQHDHWQKTSREAALLWNRVIQEKILSKVPGDEQ